MGKTTEEQPACKPGQCGQHPAKANAAQRQSIGGGRQGPQRQGGRDALQGGQAHAQRVHGPALLKARQEGEQDQHDGGGIDGVEYRGGQPDDGGKAKVGHQHTGRSKKGGKGRVGDAGQQLVEILSHAGDQAHAGVEACDHKNGRNKHKARPAEQLLCQSGEHLGTGGKARIHRAGLGPGVAQHGVDHQQQPACNKTGTVYPGLATGAEVLTALAQTLFGRAGLVLVAAIFVIACFNTCVGLIACVGQYFHQLLPRIPYPAIAAFFAVASMLVSNLGLAAIIRLSTPVLNAIYPAAIVLILLSFMPGLEKHRAVYPLCMGLTALQSIAAALPLGAVSAAANALPLGSMGFGWVLPALAGLAGGLLLNKSDLQ